MQSRSISKAFGVYKSVVFAHNASNSMSFNDFKSVLTLNSYCKLMNYTQSYTFTKSNGFTRNRNTVTILPEVKNALVEELYLMGIQGYGLTFSGEDDSGFTQLDYHNGFYKIENCLGAIECHEESMDAYMSATINRTSRNLNEIVENIGDMQLSKEYGGWENNEGGHGTILFSLDGCEIEFLNCPCEGCGFTSDACECTFCECGQNLGVEPSEKLCDSCK